MITHHIPEEMLIAYGAGNLSEAWSLLVATHLTMCPTCRSDIEKIEALGGVFLGTLEPTPPGPALFPALMASIDAGPQPSCTHMPDPVPEKRDTGTPRVLPDPVFSYVGQDLHQLTWTRLGIGTFQVPVRTRDKTAKARLLRVIPGVSVPDHGHRGDELTLVLTGSFQTHQGQFRWGDVEVADPDIEHMPVADWGEDCICLAVTDAPLRFKSMTARLIQPFIGI